MIPDPHSHTGPGPGGRNQCIRNTDTVTNPTNTWARFCDTYGKSPKFDHTTKLRPLLNFVLKMQLTDYNGWDSSIFIARHYLTLSNFRSMFSI